MVEDDTETDSAPRVEVQSDPVQQSQSSNGPHLIQHITPTYQPYTNFNQLRLDNLVAEFFLPQVNHIYNKVTGKRETADSLLNGEDREVWNRSVSNELGRLAQGNKYGVKLTDTIEFIAGSQVPSNQTVTYAQMVFDF